MTLARGVPVVADAVILGIFPWCFTPEMYADRPEFVAALKDFVRGRPAQALGGIPRPVPGGHRPRRRRCARDILAPMLITFGGRDLCTSTLFAPALTDGIADGTLVVFDHLSHAGLHEDPETFNAASLKFLLSTGCRRQVTGRSAPRPGRHLDGTIGARATPPRTPGPRRSRGSRRETAYLTEGQGRAPPRGGLFQILGPGEYAGHQVGLV